MHDQADELRSLARRGSGFASGDSPRWITVAGGKGGVGTTSIALGLAHALALAGRRTVLVDGDLSGADLAAYVGIEPRYTIGDVLAARRTVHEALEGGPAGMQFLLGPSLEPRPLDCPSSAQERLIAQLRDLSQHADAVVVDAGAGTHRAMRRFWQAADDLVLVTTTDPVAIVDTYAALKQLYTREPNQEVHAIVNQGTDPLESTAVGDRLGEACRRFLALSLTSVTVIPSDAELQSVAGALRAVLPDAPRSPAAARFESWAEAWIARSSSPRRRHGTSRGPHSALTGPITGTYEASSSAAHDAPLGHSS